MLQYKQRFGCVPMLLTIADKDLLDRLIEQFDQRSSFEPMEVFSNINSTALYKPHMTYAEIGKQIGVCGQRVRQLETKALNKLRFQAKKYNLKSFLEA